MLEKREKNKAKPFQHTYLTLNMIIHRMFVVRLLMIIIIVHYHQAKNKCSVGKMIMDNKFCLATNRKITFNPCPVTWWLRKSKKKRDRWQNNNNIIHIGNNRGKSLFFFHFHILKHTMEKCCFVSFRLFLPISFHSFIHFFIECKKESNVADIQQ